MPQLIKVKMFGKEVEIHDSFTFKPPGGTKNLTSMVAKLHNVFYLNAFFAPAQLEDGVHGLLSLSEEKRLVAPLDEFLGEGRGLRELDIAYGTTYLVGVLIATVSAASLNNNNAAETFVIYAPNLTSKGGGYVVHDKTNPNAVTKGQVHFEQISTQQLWVFLDIVKEKGGADFAKLWPGLTVHLEYYFKSTGDTNNIVCTPCSNLIGRFLKVYKGWSNKDHASADFIVPGTAKGGPEWSIPDKVKCTQCKCEINFLKRDPEAKTEYGPTNSVIAMLLCPACKKFFSVQKVLKEG